MIIFNNYILYRFITKHLCFLVVHEAYSSKTVRLLKLIAPAESIFLFELHEVNGQGVLHEQGGPRLEGTRSKERIYGLRCARVCE